MPRPSIQDVLIGWGLACLILLLAEGLKLICYASSLGEVIAGLAAVAVSGTGVWITIVVFFEEPG
jgi:hypothetical protein